MEIKTLVDAGPLVGWFNAADQWHQWSIEALSTRRGQLHTTEIVLGEACWHLGGNTPAAHALLDLVRRGGIVLARPWPEHLADTQRIMLKYPRMDASDASLVSLAELAPNAVIVSIDKRDFVPCRGLLNRPLNLLVPD